jgi:cytochrome b pre-mRNA-processing protein 3
MLNSFRARTDIRRKAGEIYGAIVTQARQPEFYARLGIPDTPVGRYEMVVLHLVLVLERIGKPTSAPDLPRLLVEAFVADMDDSLRELATGDLAVAKKVRRAATGLYERSMAYRVALGAGDAAALSDALTLQIFEGAAGAPSRALAAYMIAAARGLAGQQDATIAGGEVVFPPAQSIGGQP